MSLTMTLGQIAAVLGVETSHTDIQVRGALQDSRKIKPGQLYIALVGERVDGHDYVAQAREAGASAALVSKVVDDALPQICVPDVAKAFAELASFWQKQCKAKVVAITGSNGKTSLKEMVTSILSEVGTVTATLGNLNNQLGVPLTVCNMHQDDDFAVIEMGASYLGDIQELVEIVTPDVSVVNNVAPAHIEGFGSIEGVAITKGAIYSGLADDGIAVVNADMPYQAIWAPMIGERQVIRFGMKEDADIRVEYMQLDPLSSHFMVMMDEVNHHFSLNLPGEHNVNNALAAIAICRALKVPVAAMVRGLQNMKPVPHRLQKRTGLGGATLIDDTYNANPGSYTQALKVLAQFPTPRWLVLGDFGELGDDEIAIHKAMGAEAKAAGVDRLFAVGEISVNVADTFGEGAQHYADSAPLLDTLKQELQANVTCLFKGSRFMQLDKLVEQLIEGEH